MQTGQTSTIISAFDNSSSKPNTNLHTHNNSLMHQLSSSNHTGTNAAVRMKSQGEQWAATVFSRNAAMVRSGQPAVLPLNQDFQPFHQSVHYDTNNHRGGPVLATTQTGGVGLHDSLVMTTKPTPVMTANMVDESRHSP